MADTSRWTALVEASASSTHQVLPRWSFLGQLQRSFDNGFGIHAGLRQTEYNDSRVNQGTLTLERYWSNYRMAYTHYASEIHGGGSASSQLLQWSYYYADHSNVGLGYAAGKEVERPGVGALITTDIESWTLLGRHWFDRHWALSYELGLHDQKNRYTREGLRLGVRYQF